MRDESSALPELWDVDRLNRPGMWQTTVLVRGKDVIIPIDLIVPEGASTGEGRHGARIPPHGKRAARRAVGLEAALVDHSPMIVAALDPADSRQVTVEVAGVAALLVAKAHKIRDRLGTGRTDRLSDKDAADVFRIMQTARPAAVAETMRSLFEAPMSAEVTVQALEIMRNLFVRRAGGGVAMAQRALQLAVDPAQVATLCVAFTEQLLVSGRSAWRPGRSVGAKVVGEVADLADETASTGDSSVAVVGVEAGCGIVDGVDDDEAGGDDIGGGDDSLGGIGKQDTTQTVTVKVSV